MSTFTFVFFYELWTDIFVYDNQFDNSKSCTTINCNGTDIFSSINEAWRHISNLNNINEWNIILLTDLIINDTINMSIDTNISITIDCQKHLLYSNNNLIHNQTFCNLYVYSNNFLTINHQNATIIDNIPPYGIVTLQS